MRIDFHTHTFPARIAAPAIKKMQASSHAAAFLDGTGPALTASLQKAGLDRAVVLPHCGELDIIPVSCALQLLAYHAANELGRNVDKPRNLAKSVTVE